MSYPPSEYGPDPVSSENYPDYESAEEAWRSQRRRTTYLPAVFLALVIGALVGALLSRRQRPQKDSVQAAKEWLETAYAQLTEKLPQLAEKLPSSPKNSRISPKRFLIRKSPLYSGARKPFLSRLIKSARN